MRAGKRGVVGFGMLKVGEISCTRGNRQNRKTNE